MVLSRLIKKRTYKRNSAPQLTGNQRPRIEAAILHVISESRKVRAQLRADDGWDSAGGVGEHPEGLSFCGIDQGFSLPREVALVEWTEADAIRSATAGSFFIRQ